MDNFYTETGLPGLSGKNSLQINIQFAIFSLHIFDTSRIHIIESEYFSFHKINKIKSGTFLFHFVPRDRRR